MKTIADIAEAIRGIPRDTPFVVRIAEKDATTDGVVTDVYIGHCALTDGKVVILECGPETDRFRCGVCGHYAKKDTGEHT